MNDRTQGCATVDVELLLDNAACASQVRELLRTDDGDETALREAVRMNVVEPLLKLLSQSAVPDNGLAARLRAAGMAEVPLDRQPVHLRPLLEAAKSSPSATPDTDAIIERCVAVVKNGVWVDGPEGTIEGQIARALRALKATDRCEP